MASHHIQQIIDGIIKNPEDNIEKLDLIYTNDEHLSIYRKKNRKKFAYFNEDKPIDEATENRIKTLAIPPAWENVKISYLSNGHLQAVGRDLKQRKQYRYHPLWSKVRNETKFYRMEEFGRKLPLLRSIIEANLALKDWSKQKLVSLVIALMDETSMRIGNDYYANHNHTYGLSTLRKRHVNHSGKNLRFEYQGKRGKKHKVTIRNKKLIRLVRQCEELPGWELFQFYDENGIKRRVDSTMVNDFLFDVCKAEFTAKDFRTWSASVAFFEFLYKSGIADSEDDKKKKILEGYDSAASVLGNTRNVCRKYYVHPKIERTYHEKGVLKTPNDVEIINGKIDNQSNYEILLLEMIKDYFPVTLKNN